MRNRDFYDCDELSVDIIAFIVNRYTEALEAAEKRYEAL